MPGLYDLSFDEVAAFLPDDPPFRARQVWDGLYRRTLAISEMTDLPLALRQRLSAAPELQPGLALAGRTASDGGETVKWGWRLHDGAVVETVLMYYPDRATVCVSTQAGCAMNCSFCATGQAGFTRHLTAGEIVEQVVAAMTEAARPTPSQSARPSPASTSRPTSAPDRGPRRSGHDSEGGRRSARTRGHAERVANVVFMGMGEPMANYDAVWTAIERLHGDLGFSARHLTVSTVGLVPGIRRLAKEALPVNLAVSLHAANDELRNRLVPINRRWPLAALVAACREYRAMKGRRLSFEWALIDGVNDRPSDADELADLVRPLGAHVNLIPLNPTPGYLTRGTPAPGVRAFRTHLVDQGVNATVRRNRGGDIDAACGQLAGSVVLRPQSRSRVPD